MHSHVIWLDDIKSGFSWLELQNSIDERLSDAKLAGIKIKSVQTFFDGDRVFLIIYSKGDRKFTELLV